MQLVSCPSCGAQVRFRSHAAVMAVCEYCKATVLKDGDAVKDMGKMSAVLEDYSPIQIGTSGVHGGRSFDVVGRIQLSYDEGLWNEWYLLFQDGGTSWLGDASGQYMLTTERASDDIVPDFEDLRPAQVVNLGGARYMAADIREARCTGGQGELPFQVGEGWRARVADLRAGPSFITLDYSDGVRPLVYTGQAVTLESMKCQLLREDDAIKASAGRYRGKVDALDCPSCGGNIGYLPGVTTNLVCPACQAQLDASGPEAAVLAAGERVGAVSTTLKLGAVAKINGTQHTVIGVMRRVDEEHTEWTEYLLYNTRSAFFWLVETDDGWSRANLLDHWPEWSTPGAGTATLDKASYRKLYDYTATVTFAAGAFNWRVKAGDTAQVHEFEAGQAKLAAEITRHELSWSRSTHVAFDQVRAWFGAEGAAVAAPRAAGTSGAASKFLWAILGLNAIPLLAAFDETWIYPAIAALAIYLPSKFMTEEHKEKP